MHSVLAVAGLTYVNAPESYACFHFRTMDNLQKRQRFTILVIILCVLLKPDTAWANAGWVFVGPFLAGFIAILTFSLLVTFESWVLSYFLKMAIWKALNAAFLGNLASAMVGHWLPTTIYLGDILTGLVFSNASAPSILAASSEFVLMAAGVSTAVEFPIIHRFATGHWWPKNDRLGMSQMIAVLAMNILTTLLLVGFALFVDTYVTSIADTYAY